MREAVRRGRLAGMAVRRHYCRSCRRDVVAEADPVSHVLHFFLTLVTVGLWFPVWLLALGSRRWHCRYCGARTFGGKASTAFQRLVLAVLLGFLLLFAALLWAGWMAGI